MFSRFSSLILGSLLLTASNVAAQTFTACDPLNVTCPPDVALGTHLFENYSNSYIPDSHVWNTSSGNIEWDDKGADYVIHGSGDAPTMISKFYLFFGRVSVIMQAAKGQGVVSSIVLLSDDLDEIDWEIIGSNGTFVETNYFGKNDTSSYDRAIYYPVAEDTTDSWHNYTTVWTADKIDWMLDGKVVRTLHYADAMGGQRFPQTPMTLKVGNWPAGDPKSPTGTIEWAGGPIDYRQAPFTMTVQSIEVQDFTNGSSYTYSDHSGSWQSIKVASGNSTIANRLGRPHGLKNDFNALPKGVKIGIAAAIIGAVAIIILSIAICCIKNRRAGRKERAIADAEWEKSQTELQHYKRMRRAEHEIHAPRAGYI